ncbi:hypothetical protein Vretimale_1410 [Volvox reticuliferus]|uniref:Uncharacterized protein n=1 Tax=Volvox reticuliferus TaxID=1737510 RepID=A0A8J4CKX9_9CHLO|nr:hypothetical protein Vretifemale_10805 [Volvox reticuliferus]GIL95366.1 hypothetical protein Vretimale_1410 [Volvox reticuliferus]
MATVLLKRGATCLCQRSERVGPAATRFCVARKFPHPRQEYAVASLGTSCPSSPDDAIPLAVAGLVVLGSAALPYGADVLMQYLVRRREGEDSESVRDMVRLTSGAAGHDDTGDVASHTEPLYNGIWPFRGHRLGSGGLQSWLCICWEPLFSGCISSTDLHCSITWATERQTVRQTDRQANMVVGPSMCAMPRCSCSNPLVFIPVFASPTERPHPAQLSYPTSSFAINALLHGLLYHVHAHEPFEPICFPYVGARRLLYQDPLFFHVTDHHHHHKYT